VDVVRQAIYSRTGYKHLNNLTGYIDVAETVAEAFSNLPGTVPEGALPPQMAWFNTCLGVLEDQMWPPLDIEAIRATLILAYAQCDPAGLSQVLTGSLAASVERDTLRRGLMEAITGNVTLREQLVDLLQATGEVSAARLVAGLRRDRVAVPIKIHGLRGTLQLFAIQDNAPDLRIPVSSLPWSQRAEGVLEMDTVKHLLRQRGRLLFEWINDTSRGTLTTRLSELLETCKGDLPPRLSPLEESDWVVFGQVLQDLADLLGWPLLVEQDE
jgi:hypothetical protein